MNLDFSLGKTVRLVERMRHQIRADMFNALNHTNLSGLRTSLNDAFFGQLLGTAGARVFQLNSRFSFLEALHSGAFRPFECVVLEQPVTNRSRTVRPFLNRPDSHKMDPVR